MKDYLQYAEAVDAESASLLSPASDTWLKIDADEEFFLQLA